MKKGMALFGICLLFFCCVPMKVEAAEDVDFDTEREEMLRYLEDEDVFGDLEGLAKQETGITFSQLTGLIAENGVMGSLWEIGAYVLQSLIGEIRTNRQNMMHILVLVLLFCVLQNFLELTDNSYISELCYMLTYLVMMLLLLKSFSVTAQIVRDMLDTVTGFMRMLLPAYLGVMVFAGSAMSAMSFYELTFFILYGIEMIMTYFLLPLISVYVLFQLANYTLKDEVFSKTADLIHDLFGWGAKIILTLVVGLNVVQSMIAPAVDYASRTTLTKSLGLIPGIGGAASAIGDILIGSGMVIKNSVGVAAIFLLLFLTLVPFIKVLIITFLYKCMAALLEPIADKRIAKAMAGMATGGGMLMRMITTTVFMIFITIAMISATSSFMT
ncbi:MAG: stage III sporulation protein AE [Lachnospiraceae bacterium]|nr:stage III sporulation protein AE [Lachnospiraceae bacterium]